MKKLILITLVGMVLFSCKRKEYKYEIHGKVYVPTSGINPLHNAVWYTDTISFDGDTIYYFNSDGSKVRIKPPYFIINNLK